MAQQRAQQYIAAHAGMAIEVVADNLIKTVSPTDTTSVGYLVTRVPRRESVEYEIICSSNRRGFDRIEAARHLGFHMVTGREYERVE